MALCLLALFASASSCNQGSPRGNASTASQPRLSSPAPASSPSPVITHLFADCTSAAPQGTRVDTGTRDGLTLIRPEGWTDTSNDSEGGFFQLTAPASYGYAPTTFTLAQPIGILPESTTAYDITRQEIAAAAARHASFTAGPIFDCQVGSDPASFFLYADGGTTGYELYVIHNRLLYGALLASTGGMSDRTVGVYKGIVGSWTFAV